MQKIIERSIKHPISIIMIYCVFILLGINTISRMHINFLPEIKIPKMVISTSYAGFPANEVRELITIPLEEALSSLNGIKNITSISRKSISTIEIELHWEADLQKASIEIREIIDSAFQSLPSGVQKPMILPISSNTEPLMILSVVPRNGNLIEAKNYAQYTIKPKFQRVEGVGSIILNGGTIEEIKVLFDDNFLNARGLSADQISDSIAQSNLDYPAGTIISGEKEFIIKIDGRYKTIEEIEEQLVAGVQSPVKIKDIAKVESKTAEQNSAFHLGDQEAVGIYIYQNDMANPVQTSALLKKEIAELKDFFENQLEIQVLHDSSVMVLDSLKDLAFSGILGVLLAFIILYIFFKKFIPSIITALTIPLSLVTSLFFLGLCGKTINTVTLGGLTIGIGMVVDNSVVIIEHLIARIKSPKEFNPLMISTVSSEMTSSTLGSTLTTLIIFIPIFFLPGLMGALFSDLAAAVCFSLISSWIISFSLVPVLYTLWYRPALITTTPKKVNESFYYKVLNFILKRRLLTLSGFILCFLLIIPLFFLLEAEFMPSVNTEKIHLSVINENGTHIKKLKEVNNSIYNYIQRTNDYETLYSRCGAEGDDIYYYSNPYSKKEVLHISLIPKKGKNVSNLLTDLNKNLEIKNCQFHATLPEDPLSPILNIKKYEERFFIESDKSDFILSQLRLIQKELSQFDDLNWETMPDKPRNEIEIRPKLENMANTGISPSDLSNFMMTYIYGKKVSTFYRDNQEINIMLEPNERKKIKFEDLKKLRIPTDSDSIHISDLADIQYTQQEQALIRRNKADIAILSLHQPNAKNIEEIQPLLKEYQFEPYDGSVIEENIKIIITIFLLALILLYLLLGAQFESFLTPLLLMLNIPFSFIGIAIILFFTRETINLYSILGILVLIGLLINNSILLFESYKQKFKETNDPLTTVIEGSKERIRPIFITTLTTIIALIPNALRIPSRTPQSSMSATIIGGLVSSTLITLLITPIIFYTYYKKRVKKDNGKIS